MTTKAQVAKEKIDKVSFIKIRNFCDSKDNIRKVKRQIPKQNAVCGKCISDW
jgi:hypothetical protein